MKIVNFQLYELNYCYINDSNNIDCLVLYRNRIIGSNGGI